jgi:hypothetical protein
MPGVMSVTYRANFSPFEPEMWSSSHQVRFAPHKLHVEAEWSARLRKLNMNTREKSEIRELTAAELEEVTGGNLVCATGAHIQQATLTVRERTPVANFGGILIY